MLVRLAGMWTDPQGVLHAAGEHVDVDMVTLAELEEQGVVETMTEPKDPDWTNQTGTDPAADPDWTNQTGTDPAADPDWTNQTGTDPQKDPV